MVQLHGILIAYEMRRGGPSEVKEAVFRTSTKGKEAKKTKIQSYGPTHNLPKQNKALVLPTQDSNVRGLGYRMGRC